MTRSIFAVALLLALIGVGSLPASVAAGQHTARGSGRDNNGDPFRIRAEGKPSQASGRVSFGDFGVAAGSQHGTVDCLWVDGRRAVLSGVLDAPVGGLPYFFIVVKDDPKDTTRPRDLFFGALVGGRVDCATAYEPLPRTARIKRGDITVA